MIDRTEFDVRIAEHERRTGAANDREWQQAAPPPRLGPREALATALRALAARLDPGPAPARKTARSSTPAAR